MKKMITRWYQKDEYLNAFMNLLEQVPLDIQCEIAIDIILQSSSMIDREYEKVIGEVAEYNPRDFKRWYDKNPNLHAAIESLRDLSSEQIEQIVKPYTDKLLDYLHLRIKGDD